MKSFSNNEADGVLEKLLKGEMKRAGRAGAPCSQFDPDLSAAYIERNLTLGETSRYEIHLASCSSCRIQVASLARLGYQVDPSETEPAKAAAVPIRPARPEAESSRSGLWGYLLRPQWIAVATATLVLLAGVPVFLILRNAKQPGAARASQPENQIADSYTSAPGTRGPEVPTANQPSISSEGGAPPSSSRPGHGSPELVKDEEAPAANPSVVPGETAGPSKAGAAEPVPAPPADAPAPKTDAENRRGETDSRVSQTTQVVQNSPQQTNQQQNNQRQNSVEGATVTSAGALSQYKGREQSAGQDR